MAEWRRVHDWRVHQLDKLPNVEVYRGSRPSAANILEYGCEHVALATGAH
jgi:dimethylamine/trimethylamine dehydrogenase